MMDYAENYKVVVEVGKDYMWTEQSEKDGLDSSAVYVSLRSGDSP